MYVGQNRHGSQSSVPQGVAHVACWMPSRSFCRLFPFVPFHHPLHSDWLYFGRCLALLLHVELAVSALIVPERGSHEHVVYGSARPRIGSHAGV